LWGYLKNAVFMPPLPTTNPEHDIKITEALAISY
jgi:hypothetical protein